MADSRFLLFLRFIEDAFDCDLLFHIEYLIREFRKIKQIRRVDLKGIGNMIQHLEAHGTDKIRGF